MYPSRVVSDSTTLICREIIIRRRVVKPHKTKSDDYEDRTTLIWRRFDVLVGNHSKRGNIIIKF